MATNIRNSNADLSLSAAARQRLRNRETVRGYYNDMGGNRGNCTYGIGILVHRGPCTEEELQRPLSVTQIETSFSAALRDAKSAVRRSVTHQSLTQEQFDGLVSYVYNTGANGATRTLQLIDRGRLGEAADVMLRNIRTTIGGRRVSAHGLIARRREESAPFLDARQE
ncbi:glycoside hydrolase family protein [Pseudoduganella ginsengisoli]|uniref:Lysozyme n=1 Tax=Pseudoduganella ginsengisoli TaxID=1462440 RepID=A0A6L6Q569_9BURK|nr:glycoside hydrolase family protein [Pseudoduganella ginsengisoli]MTW04401.1 glycoside hydrolase family protein [Pseudoduganella ginsengisoli]